VRRPTDRLCGSAGREQQVRPSRCGHAQTCVRSSLRLFIYLATGCAFTAPTHNRALCIGVAGAARQKLRCRRLRKVAPAARAAAGRSRNGAKGWRFFLYLNFISYPNVLSADLNNYIATCSIFSKSSARLSSSC
jgi:hypothetical protein